MDWHLIVPREGAFTKEEAREAREVRMRCGRPMQMAGPFGVKDGTLPLSPEDILLAAQALTGHSLSQHEETLRQGYAALPGGHRMGVCGHMMQDGLFFFSSLCVRMAHQVKGAAVPLYGQVKGQNVLILGGPGAGKTTFLRLITGALQPDTGSIRVAPTVQFNYVDQSRVLLNEEKSVLEEIGEGLSTVQLGSETISVWTYLRRFLFDERRINTKINRLSGGEKARLALAKILLKGGNFLLLDEPTNDLDLSSLRLLEEALLDFNGCLIAVSHDRYFLNRISTHILGFDGEGKAFFTPGDYDYYLDVRKQIAIMPDVKPLAAGLQESFEWFRQNRDAVMRRPYMEYIDVNLK